MKEFWETGNDQCEAAYAAFELWVSLYDPNGEMDLLDQIGAYAHHECPLAHEAQAAMDAG